MKVDVRKVGDDVAIILPNELLAQLEWALATFLKLNSHTAV